MSEVVITVFEQMLPSLHSSHLTRILAMQTVGQVEGKMLTTLILHEVLITK